MCILAGNREAAENLSKPASAGTKIPACGACANCFHLADRVAIATERAGTPPPIPL